MCGGVYLYELELCDKLGVGKTMNRKNTDFVGEVCCVV